MEKRLHNLIDEIYALAHIISLLFEHVENADIRINPHAVARLGEMIADNVVRIAELLPDKYHDP